jgi:hypothetical protein
MEDAAKNPIIVKEKKKVMDNGWGSIYGMAFLGALVYYIQHATSFWDGLLGIAKAIFWPAMMIYKLLDSLKM